jgi:hypothetical protein
LQQHSLLLAPFLLLLRFIQFEWLILSDGARMHASIGRFTASLVATRPV